MRWALVTLIAVAACAHDRPAARTPARRPWLDPQLHVEIDNQLGAPFRLVEARLAITEELLAFSRACAPDDQACSQTLGRQTLFDSLCPVGSHALDVDLVYRGEGAGIFSYLRNYTFRARSHHPFAAEGGRRLEIKIVAYDSGGATTPLENRPAIRFEERLLDL